MIISPKCQTEHDIIYNNNNNSTWNFSICSLSLLYINVDIDKVKSYERV